MAGAAAADISLEASACPSSSSSSPRAQAGNRLLVALSGEGDGSVLRGWRKVLDPDGKFAVSCQDVRQAQAACSADFDFEAAIALFSRGSDAEPGVLSLSDVAPDLHELLERFKTWVRENFGGPEALLTSFDRDNVGRVSDDRFMRLCRTRGFDCNASELHELYCCIDVEDLGAVTPDDVVFLEVDQKKRDSKIAKLRLRQREERAQDNLISKYSECATMPPRHRLGPRPWLAPDYEHLPSYVRQKRGEWKRELYRRGLQARIDFQQHLCDTYGSDVRAWRRVLDPKEEFAVSIKTVRTYCRKVNLTLDISSLWKSLDLDGDGIFQLEELCAEPADFLACFQKWAHESFGSCSALWNHQKMVQARLSIHQAGTWFSDKKMLRSTFGNILKQLGWSPTSIKAKTTVLEALDLHGCGFISLQDLQWLDKWQVPQWLCSQADPAAWADIRSKILQEYGHPLRAWRCLLDTDDSNQISWKEFRRACKQLRFNGNVAGAWRALDKDHSGTITMEEFDASSAEMLKSFKEWAERKFGSVERMFTTLDVDSSQTISLAELKRACSKHEWQGPVQLLFNCLDVDGRRDKAGSNAGKRSLSLQEVAFLDSWDASGPTREEREETTMTTLLERGLEASLSSSKPRANSLPIVRSRRASMSLSTCEGRNSAGSETLSSTFLQAELAEFASIKTEEVESSRTGSSRSSSVSTAASSMQNSRELASVAASPLAGKCKGKLDVRAKRSDAAHRNARRAEERRRPASQSRIEQVPSPCRGRMTHSSSSPVFVGRIMLCQHPNRDPESRPKLVGKSASRCRRGSLGKLAHTSGPIERALQGM